MDGIREPIVLKGKDKEIDALKKDLRDYSTLSNKLEEAQLAIEKTSDVIGQLSVRKRYKGFVESGTKPHSFTRSKTRFLALAYLLHVARKST